jgi:hypothetical protein
VLAVHWGATRVVVICGKIAVKFPLGEHGRCCNIFEAGIWERNKERPTRSRHLCPVLWCHPQGKVLIMPAAVPLVPAADPIAMLSAMHGDDWWDYRSGGDDGQPTEPKSADWGMLDGELVAVDYAAIGP